MRAAIIILGVFWIASMFLIFGKDMFRVTIGVIHAREQAQRSDMIKPRPMRELMGRTIVHTY